MPTQLFPFQPDGSAPVVERFEFATDLIVSHDGTESRAPVRALPRITVSGKYRFPTTTPEGFTARELLAAGGMAHIALPQHIASVNSVDSLATGLNANTGQFVSGFENIAAQLQTAPEPAAPGSTWLAPSCAAWLPNAYSLQYLGSARKLFDAQLSFTLVGYREDITPAAPGPEGVLEFPTHYGIGVQPSEQMTAAQDRADNGRAWLLQQRYIKRAIRLQIALSGRAQIQAFRRFLYAARGRLNPFVYQPAQDEFASLWRLGTDAVEIEYRTTHHARCSIELAYVGEHSPEWITAP